MNTSKIIIIKQENRVGWISTAKAKGLSINYSVANAFNKEELYESLEEVGASKMAVTTNSKELDSFLKEKGYYVCPIEKGDAPYINKLKHLITPYKRINVNVKEQSR